MVSVSSAAAVATMYVHKQRAVGRGCDRFHRLPTGGSFYQCHVVSNINYAGYRVLICAFVCFCLAAAASSAKHGLCHRVKETEE